MSLNLIKGKFCAAFFASLHKDRKLITQLPLAFSSPWSRPRKPDLRRLSRFLYSLFSYSICNFKNSSIILVVILLIYSKNLNLNSCIILFYLQLLSPSMKIITQCFNMSNFFQFFVCLESKLTDV